MPFRNPGWLRSVRWQGLYRGRGNYQKDSTLLTFWLHLSLAAEGGSGKREVFSEWSPQKRKSTGHAPSRRETGQLWALAAAAFKNRTIKLQGKQKQAKISDPWEQSCAALNVTLAVGGFMFVSDSCSNQLSLQIKRGFSYLLTLQIHPEIWKSCLVLAVSGITNFVTGI